MIGRIRRKTFRIEFKRHFISLKRRTVRLTKHGVVEDSTFFSAGTVYLEEKARLSQDLSTSSDVSVRAEVEDGSLLGARKLWLSKLCSSDTSRFTLTVSDPSTSGRVRDLPHARTSSSARDPPCSSTSFASNREQSPLEKFNMSTDSGTYSRWSFSETRIQFLLRADTIQAFVHLPKSRLAFSFVSVANMLTPGSLHPQRRSIPLKKNPVTPSTSATCISKSMVFLFGSLSPT